jgi:hypothetical protein
MHYLGLFFNLANVVSCSDLLYLYHSKAWHDSITAIEISEVCLMYLFIIVGILYFVIQVRKLIKNKES